MPNIAATRCSTLSSSGKKSFRSSSRCTCRQSTPNSALKVPGSRLMVLAMKSRGSPGGNRHWRSNDPGEIGSCGCSARLATSTPPHREHQRKKGTNRTTPDREQGEGGSSATLTQVASSTTGVPTSHESSAPSVSIHHSRASRTVRNQPPCKGVTAGLRGAGFGDACRSHWYKIICQISPKTNLAAACCSCQTGYRRHRRPHRHKEPAPGRRRPLSTFRPFGVSGW